MAILLDGEEYDICNASEEVSEEDFKNLSPEEIIKKTAYFPDESDINSLLANPKDIPQYWQYVPWVYFWGTLEFDKKTKLFCLKGMMLNRKMKIWHKFCCYHDAQWFIDNFESVDLTVCIIYYT